MAVTIVPQVRGAVKLAWPWFGVPGELLIRRASLRPCDASRFISVLRDAKAQLDVLASIRDRYARRWPADELAPLQQRMCAKGGAPRVDRAQ